MWRAIFALPFLLLFVWALNQESAPPPECEEWEWVTVTFNGRHIGGGHIGPQPVKVRQCRKYLSSQPE